MAREAQKCFFSHLESLVMSVSSCSTLLPEDEEGLESVHHHSATASGKSTRCTTSASSIDSRYTGASTSSSRLNATTQHSRAPSTPKSTTSTNSIRSDRSTSSSSGNRVSDHTRRHIASSCNPASPNGCNMQLTTGHKLLLRSNLPKINHMSPSLGVDVFSAKHPMIPKRYVPPWQLDMKNRARTLQVSMQQDPFFNDISCLIILE